MGISRSFSSVVVVAVGVLVVGFAGRAAAADRSGALGPVRVQVSKTSLGRIQCPVDVEYTATLEFPQPHPYEFKFDYHWDRSDGVVTEDKRVLVTPEQGPMTFHHTWSLGTSGHKYKIRLGFTAESGKNKVGARAPSRPALRAPTRAGAPARPHAVPATRSAKIAALRSKALRASSITAARSPSASSSASRRPRNSALNAGASGIAGNS